MLLCFPSRLDDSFASKMFISKEYLCKFCLFLLIYRTEANYDEKVKLEINGGLH